MISLKKKKELDTENGLVVAKHLGRGEGWGWLGVGRKRSKHINFQS